MFSLSILSSKQKRKLEFEAKKRILVDYAFNILIIFSAFVALLLVLKIVLLVKINMVTNTDALLLAEKIETKIKDKETEIKSFNKTISLFNAIKQDYLDTSNILYNLSLLIPSNSKLYSIQFSKEKKELKIQGETPWRNDVLSLQENLEKSNYFTEINFPLSNFTKKENIDFYFDVKVADKAANNE